VGDAACSAESQRCIAAAFTTGDYGSLTSVPQEDVRWRTIFIIAIVVGVFFRLWHADLKLYNPDEANTSLRISGHTNHDLGTFENDGKVHSIRDLRVFGAPTPQTQPAAIVRSLAHEDPQHPPLYFLAMFASERATGDSIFWRRFPSIVFGILAIAAAWWFGRELFGAPWPAWCLAALVAVSPFHVAFAQEAREYSLFLLLLCLSSASLLAALRSGRPIAFAAYAASVALGLWSFTLFAFVAASHAAYLALPVSGADLRRRLFGLGALTAGALSFLPWLLNLMQRAGVAAEDTAWQTTSLTAPLYLAKLVFNLGTVFFDLDYLSLLFAPVAGLCIVIAACTSWVFLRRAGPRVWFLPVTLGVITVCVLIAPDLIKHETRATQSRYLLSLWVAIEAGVAGGAWMALRSAHGIKKSAWNAALGGLLACGIVSCAVASNARFWWISGAPQLRAFPAITDRLQALPGPTVVYFENNDELLLLEPLSGGNISFDLHRQLDEAALRSAPHPYAVLTSEEASHVVVLPEIARVPVESTFEMRPDPALDRLRHSNNAARKTPDRLDLALYGLAEARSTR
jgi:uncharacterized membrane protein